MNLYSEVTAVIDKKLGVWLPPSEELEKLIEELAGVKVQASLKDGELRISGKLDALVSAEDSLRGYIQEKEESSNMIVINEIITEENSNDCNEPNVVILNGSELVGDDNDEDDVGLSIEGSHSETNGEECVKMTHYKFSCSMCSFKSQREGQFRRHVILHETIKTVLECDQCDYRTLRSTQLTRHKVSHSVVTLLCPASCGYTTDDPLLLAKHQKRTNHDVRDVLANSNGKEVGIVDIIIRKCDKCPYKTDRLYRFERHLRTHTAGDGQSNFNCPDCNFITFKKTHFTRHVRDVHSGTRPHLCHTCGKAFKRADALRQHSLQHYSGPEEVAEAQLIAYQCPICARLCHSKHRLENHLAIHSSERAYLCEVCGAAFKTRSVHRKHVMNIHENPASHSCELCDRRFNTKYDLERHMKRKRHPSKADAQNENKRKRKKKAAAAA